MSDVQVEVNAQMAEVLRGIRALIDANAQLILADQMAEAFGIIKCNLDPEDSGCSIPCDICNLMIAQKTRDAFIAVRQKAKIDALLGEVEVK